MTTLVHAPSPRRAVFVPSIEIAPVQGQLFGRRQSGSLYHPAPEGPVRPLTLKKGLFLLALLLGYLTFLVVDVGVEVFVENPAASVLVLVLVAALLSVRVAGRPFVGSAIAELKRRRAFRAARRASLLGDTVEGVVVAVSRAEMRSLSGGQPARRGIRYADWGPFALRTSQGVVFVDPSFAWIGDGAGPSLGAGQEVELVGELHPGTLPGFELDDSSYRSAGTPRVARGTQERPLIITPR